MEQFRVSPAAAVVSKRKRQSYAPEQIEKAVTLARQVGAEAAAVTLNKTLATTDHLVPSTIRQWLSRWRTNGAFWTNPGKRGRPELLSSVDGGQQEWERQVGSFRDQGAPVTGRLAATIARAVLEEKAPSLLDTHGGPAKLSVSGGSKALARSGKSWRKKTTSRIIPPADSLADTRDAFYKKLSDCFPGENIPPGLLLNFDQTFQMFNPCRGYTWEKRGADRVQVSARKDGFTLCPVVSAVGVVGAQLIFSNARYPTIHPGPLLRFTHTPNHWSNEGTTIALWKTIIKPHIDITRLAMGQGDAPAIVLADAFAAHWTPAVLEVVNGIGNVAYVCVPESLTHLFQPLDLGIIAAIKQSVLRRKDEHAEEEIRTAVRENRGVVLSKSIPVLRDRVTMYIKEALSDSRICAETCCKSGFDRAGISRLLFGDDAPADIDRYVPQRACEECGEAAPVVLPEPDCGCFHDRATPVLCAGCHYNHNNLCPF